MHFNTPPRTFSVHAVALELGGMADSTQEVLNCYHPSRIPITEGFYNGVTFRRALTCSSLEEHLKKWYLLLWTRKKLDCSQSCQKIPESSFCHDFAGGITICEYLLVVLNSTCLSTAEKAHCSVCHKEKKLLALLRLAIMTPINRLINPLKGTD